MQDKVIIANFQQFIRTQRAIALDVARIESRLDALINLLTKKRGILKPIINKDEFERENAYTWKQFQEKTLKLAKEMQEKAQTPKIIKASSVDVSKVEKTKTKQ